MSVQPLPAAARTATPWRNGGGRTREVAADPGGAWRVSLAEVAAGGPFSLFPGLDRILTVVDGPGLELTVGDEAPVTVRPLRPFAFSGALPTSARLLGGPVTALNLMTRQPDTRATTADPVTDPVTAAAVAVAVAAATVPVSATVSAAVTLAPGGAELRPPAGGAVLAVALDCYDALLVSDPSTAPGPAGRAVLIELRPST